MNNIEVGPETVKDLIHIAYSCVTDNANGCSFDMDLDPDDKFMLHVELRFKMVDKKSEDKDG